MRIETLLVAFLLLLPFPAQALCLTFGVTATGLNFGVYDPGAAGATTSTGSVTVQCGVGILPSFAVSLSKGHGTYAQRTLANGSDALNYNLYADAAHMTVWGNGLDGTVTQSLSGLITLGGTTYTVYGQAEAGQHPAPGMYDDTITVTVTF